MFNLLQSAFRAATAALGAVVHAIGCVLGTATNLAAEAVTTVVDCGREEAARRHAELVHLQQSLNSELARMATAFTVAERFARLETAKSFLWRLRRLLVRCVLDNTASLRAVAQSHGE